MKLIVTSKQLEDIYFGRSDRFKVVEVIKWEEDNRNQECIFIFKDLKSNNLYKGKIQRTGTPFIGYTYSSEIFNSSIELFPVKETQKVMKTDVENIEKDMGFEIVEEL